jgi:spermidine/putrescine transport system permease protein
MAGVASSSRQRSKIAPYLMILPGLAYLAIFFVVPFWSLFRTSLSTMGGSIYLPQLTFAWNFGNYAHALSTYQDQILRSLLYAFTATVVSLAISYPLAYVIAFKSGRYKNLLLGLVVLPFFVTFLVRTLAWKTILADDGVVVQTLNTVALLPPDGRLLSTSWAVIGGLIYNSMTFMILPLYVSLEKIDPRLLEASKDLYSSSFRAFTKIIFPLSVPGVLAGSLLVFIPAIGQFAINDLLGGKRDPIIGNTIEKQFGAALNKPFGAALGMMLLVLFVLCFAVFRRSKEKA